MFFKKINKLNISKQINYIRFQLLLVAATVFVIDYENTEYYNFRWMQATFIVVGGFLMILTVVLITYILDQSHFLTEFFVLIFGAILLILVGIISIVKYIDDVRYDNDATDEINTLILGILCCVCGLFMLGDWIRVFKDNFYPYLRGEYSSTSR